MESKVVATGVATPNSAEGAVATSDIVGWNGGEGLIVRGVVNVTAGAGTTAVQIRVRKGAGTGGAQVGVTLPHTLAAAASASIDYEVLDTAPAIPAAGAAPTNQYTVTIQQTGGTGAGTVNHATIGMTAAATGW